ncbi:MAG: glycosyltransferase [Deltaproteobacteria bacterium]|nr:glycosyltransferase [Candidatus Desulfobacula maris]
MKESKSRKHIDVSVLIPISEKRHDNLVKIFDAHKDILVDLEKTFEFIFVFDGFYPDDEKKLKEIAKDAPDILKLIRFNKNHGESKALTTAFHASSGENILTLPAYFQVQPVEIRKLFENFTNSTDVIVGQRYPRRDNALNRLQAKLFHKLISSFSGESFHDISCGVRLMRRNAMGRISLYGDLYRFIPLLAINKGFVVKEIPLRQAQEDIHLRVHGLGVYLRRLLDILTLFFLLKFTQKPLRFFGLLGSGLSFIGLIISAVTVFQRIFGDQALSERPLFLVGVLFLLVGVQTFFIGLVAEIIIFTHMPSEPDYNIEEIIE